MNSLIKDGYFYIAACIAEKNLKDKDRAKKLYDKWIANARFLETEAEVCEERGFLDYAIRLYKKIYVDEK